MLLVGCSAFNTDEKDTLAQPEKPVEELYNSAHNLLKNGKLKEAIEGFEVVEQQHPYSEWAIRSKILGAFSAYKLQEYEKAVPALENFIKLHPANKNTPYAFYLLALCYYEQITDVGRDQATTERALRSLEDVVNRYPGSEYARDARLKLDLVRDHLAGKEMEIGRYYQSRRELTAAINRFKNVIENYDTTSHVPEALHRISESYYALGLTTEANNYASVLGYNYPDNKWYKKSYHLLTTGKQIKEPSKGGLLGILKQK